MILFLDKQSYTKKYGYNFKQDKFEMWYEIDIRKLFYIEFFLMKKIIIWCFVVFFSLLWFSHWVNPCEPRPDCEDSLYEWESMDFGVWQSTTANNQNLSNNAIKKCEAAWWKAILKNDGYYDICQKDWITYKEKEIVLINNTNTLCKTEHQYTEWWTLKCCQWMVVDDTKNPWQKTCIINTEGTLWINMNANCLVNWQCSYNIYKTLGIRKSDQNPKVSTFVQDIILWVTMFIWTVISLILIISWVLYILASVQWSSSKADMAKKWIFNSLLALILVSWSYAVVRLVQFIATAWGW